MISDRPDSSTGLYALYNIGHGRPIALMDLIRAVEKVIDREAHVISSSCGRETCHVPEWTPRRSMRLRHRPKVELEVGAHRFVA